ncbi:hypothetical protein [Clostridium sp.]|uniref:hypothetical protein n=1 Tax=Clostridium sp. TaxID=1506 RepID=UPI0026094ECA|nr:hypothetical protein [Clostridium sp.]
MDNQGLTNPKILIEIQKLVDMMFQGNSLHDNIVYSMATYLCVPHLYEFMHYSISHEFPILADNITDFAILRNDVIHRGALVENNKTYNNIVECLQDSYDCFIEIQKQVEIAIDSAIENKDKAFEDFLRSFNVDKISLYIKQMKNLLDGAKSYASSGILPLFNRDFKKYIILPSKWVKYN